MRHNHLKNKSAHGMLSLKTHQRVVMKFGIEFKVFNMVTQPSSVSLSLDLYCLTSCAPRMLASLPLQQLKLPHLRISVLAAPSDWNTLLSNSRKPCIHLIQVSIQGHVLRESFPDPQLKSYHHPYFFNLLYFSSYLKFLPDSLWFYLLTVCPHSQDWKLCGIRDFCSFIADSAVPRTVPRTQVFAE